MSALLDEGSVFEPVEEGDAMIDGRVRRVVTGLLHRPGKKPIWWWDTVDIPVETSP